MELEGFKVRALQIVRKSRDPARCLQLMRAKASAFLESGGLGAACRETSVVREPVAVPSPRNFPHPSKDADEQVIAPVAIKMPPIEDAVVTKDNCKIGTVMFTPLTMVVGLLISQTVRCLQTMAPRVAFTDFVVRNIFMGCDMDVLSMLDVVMFNLGGLLLRVDEEPPDPGITDGVENIAKSNKQENLGTVGGGRKYNKVKNGRSATGNVVSVLGDKRMQQQVGSETMLKKADLVADGETNGQENRCDGEKKMHDVLCDSHKGTLAGGKKAERKNGTYKRKNRKSPGALIEQTVSVGVKRPNKDDLMEVDTEGGAKKVRKVGEDFGKTKENAGLSEQPCENQ